VREPDIGKQAAAVVEPPPQTVSPLVPNPAPVPPPATVRVAPHRFFNHVFQNNLVPAVIPPPVPVVAAAPPLPAAGTAAKKEEEREKALEHSKESSGHSAVAYMGPQTSFDYRPVAAAGAGVFGMFIFSAAWAATRRRDAAAIDVRRWE
jgi:hypothetical protein